MLTGFLTEAARRAAFVPPTTQAQQEVFGEMQLGNRSLAYLKGGDRLVQRLTCLAYNLLVGQRGMMDRYCRN
jgi:hypothetical protein